MAVSVQKSSYLNPLKDPAVLVRLQSEINWLEDKIKRVTEMKLPRKPSAVHEIRDLSYQLKQRELEHTFGGSEWLKYEKYAMWDLLTD
jgi:hypothetical protein